MAKILTMSRNQRGRDLAVGDIHGCFTVTDQALAAAQFQPDQGDRLFSVGDLVDRGPESIRSYEFIHRQGVYAGRGNHEDVILALLGSDKSFHNFNPLELALLRKSPAMAWHKELNDQEREQIIAAFESLPLLIEVETDIGMVGFVHGNVPIGMRWDQLKEAVQDDDFNVINNMLYGRERILENYCGGVEGIDRVFLGHTARDTIVKLGNCFYIDQGYVFKIWDEPSNSYATQLTDPHLTVAQITLSDNFLAAATGARYPDFNIIVESPHSSEQSESDRGFEPA